MNVLHTILDFLFPVYCVGCQSRNEYLCGKCLESIPAVEDILPPYIISIFDYKDPIIKRAIWMLKYRNKKGVALPLARIAHDRLLEELADLITFDNFTDPIIIPIPLHKKRLRERRFNQSELIAKEILKCDGSGGSFALMTDVLYKIKDTPKQVEIKGRKERLKNLRGAFVIKNAEYIYGRNIILVDDIITTGATINEAKKVLEKAGAKKVIGFTIAH